MNISWYAVQSYFHQGLNGYYSGKNKLLFRDLDYWKDVLKISYFTIAFFENRLPFLGEHKASTKIAWSYLSFCNSAVHLAGVGIYLLTTPVEGKEQIRNHFAYSFFEDLSRSFTFIPYSFFPGSHKAITLDLLHGMNGFTWVFSKHSRPVLHIIVSLSATFFILSTLPLRFGNNLDVIIKEYGSWVPFFEITSSVARIWLKHYQKS